MSIDYLTGCKYENFKLILSNLLEEMEEMKEKECTKWSEELDFLYEELISIQEMTEIDLYTSHNKYMSLPISGFDTFHDYFNNLGLGNSMINQSSSLTIKSKRTKKIVTKCPFCKIKLIEEDEKKRCVNCNYETKVVNRKSKTNGNLSANQQNHVRKTVNSLFVSKKLPLNLRKIYPYLTLWIVNPSTYLLPWLEYSDRKKFFDTEILNLYPKLKDVNTYYTRTIERIPKNCLNPQEFKLLTTEFYLMVERAKSIYMLQDSNIDLNDEEKYLVFERVKSVLDEENINELRLSKSTMEKLLELHTFEKYNIGNYINKLRLVIKYDETHIKYKLEKLFNCKFELAGLMFNYGEEFNLIKRPPRKYNYLQEYINLMVLIFNISHVPISIQDRENIIDIINRFNEFYKTEIQRTVNHKINSPLITVVIELILKLSYFKRYDSILNYMSRKINSSSKINYYWSRFYMANQEYLNQFNISESKPSLAFSSKL
jgi:uncharacterized Zn finger protein (UPF0148 family)